MRRPEVVIIGGGFCGLTCAKKLSKSANVTLITETPYFEFTPSVHKLLTDTGYAARIRVPFSQCLPKARVVLGTVSRVTPKAAYVGSQEIEYTYLVISRGIDYPIRLSDTKNVHTVKNGNNALRAASALETAKKALVIGGGLIGTELAAELCTKTDTSITLVHLPERLLERNPPRAGKIALKFLKKRGIDIILGEKIAARKDGTFHTDKGREIKPDITFWCAGTSSDASFLSEQFQTVITERQTLKVNTYLQVEGHPTVFAGGDITNTDEEKSAQNAERHGRLIARNILLHWRDRQLTPYTKRQGPLVISLGDWAGLLIWHGKTIDGIIPAILKKIIEKWVLFKIRYL